MSCAKLTPHEDGFHMMALSPTFSYMKGKRLGNICWAQHLHLSKRDHIYQTIVGTVVKKAMEVAEVKPTVKLVRFEIIGVAGDGRCGWRALLASANTEGYLRVPRTEAFVTRQELSIHIFIYIHT